MKTNVYVTVMILFWAYGCKKEVKKVEEVSKTELTQQFEVSGNYVSEGYVDRAEGYDWIAATVKHTDNSQLKISIRSRADKKKPTCTFDAVAQQVGDYDYQTQIEGKTILFQFTQTDLRIRAENDEGVLYFYCSGGASIGGTYAKINAPLDQDQIDKTTFSKSLFLQDVGFEVSSIEQNGRNTLTLLTYGLQEQDFMETLDIDREEVINAAGDDLNADGSPELFIFTRATNSSHNGNVYAFSVNNKKSMSRVYFQPTAEHAAINQGYRGQDQFYLVEPYLGQRFPVYGKGTAPEATREVLYKLVETETGRALEVEKTSEY